MSATIELRFEEPQETVRTGAFSIWCRTCADEDFNHFHDPASGEGMSVDEGLAAGLQPPRWRTKAEHNWIKTNRKYPFGGRPKLYAEVVTS